MIRLGDHQDRARGPEGAVFGGERAAAEAQERNQLPMSSQLCLPADPGAAVADDGPEAGLREGGVAADGTDRGDAVPGRPQRWEWRG